MVDALYQNIHRRTSTNHHFCEWLALNQPDNYHWAISGLPLLSSSSLGYSSPLIAPLMESAEPMTVDDEEPILDFSEKTRSKVHAFLMSTSVCF